MYIVQTAGAPARRTGTRGDRRSALPWSGPCAGATGACQDSTLGSPAPGMGESCVWPSELDSRSSVPRALAIASAEAGRGAGWPSEVLSCDNPGGPLFEFLLRRWDLRSLFMMGRVHTGLDITSVRACVREKKRAARRLDLNGGCADGQSIFTTRRDCGEEVMQARARARGGCASSFIWEELRKGHAFIVDGFRKRLRRDPYETHPK